MKNYKNYLLFGIGIGIGAIITNKILTYIANKKVEKTKEKLKNVVKSEDISEEIIGEENNSTSPSPTPFQKKVFTYMTNKKSERLKKMMESDDVPEGLKKGNSEENVGETPTKMYTQDKKEILKNDESTEYITNKIMEEMAKNEHPTEEDDEEETDILEEIDEDDIDIQYEDWERRINKVSEIIKEEDIGSLPGYYEQKIMYYFEDGTMLTEDEDVVGNYIDAGEDDKLIEFSPFDYETFNKIKEMVENNDIVIDLFAVSYKFSTVYEICKIHGGYNPLR